MKTLTVLAFLLSGFLAQAQQTPPEDLPVAGPGNELLILKKSPPENRNTFSSADEMVKTDSLNATQENRIAVSGEKDEYLPLQTGGKKKDD